MDLNRGQIKPKTHTQFLRDWSVQSLGSSDHQVLGPDTNQPYSYKIPEISKE